MVVIQVKLWTVSGPTAVHRSDGEGQHAGIVKKTGQVASLLIQVTTYLVVLSEDHEVIKRMLAMMR